MSDNIFMTVRELLDTYTRNLCRILHFHQQPGGKLILTDVEEGQLQRD